MSVIWFGHCQALNIGGIKWRGEIRETPFQPFRWVYKMTRIVGGFWFGSIFCRFWQWIGRNWDNIICANDIDNLQPINDKKIQTRVNNFQL